MSNRMLSLTGAACLLLVLAIVYLAAPPVSLAQGGVLVWFSVADVAVSGTPVVIGAGNARICQLTALTTNAANVRWGDALITTTRGSLIAPGGGQFIPPGGVGSAYVVDLASTYVVGTSGDKVAVTCAK